MAIQPHPKTSPAGTPANDKAPARGGGLDEHVQSRNVSDRTSIGRKIHLPSGRKSPPPKDVTGWKNLRTRASYVFPEGHRGNIGLLLSDGVIGLDVDDYEDEHQTKRGCETMRELVAQWGPLPDTYMSTSRAPETASGIHLYRVPAGTRLKDRLPDVDVIQPGHRYAVVAPSVVSWDKGHDVDPPRVYQWYGPDLKPCAEPKLEALPWLPERWLDGLRDTTERVQLDVVDFADDTAALAWLAENIPGYREPMTSVLRRAAEGLADSVDVGAHQAIVEPLNHIIFLAAEGHHGLKAAVELAHNAFFSEVLGAKDGEARRDLATAESEWSRTLTGAIAKLRAEVDNGLRQLSPIGLDAQSFEVDLAVFQERMLEIVASRISPIDTREYDLSDMGRGLVFNAAVGSNLRPVLGGNDWCYWDTQRGALTRLDPRAVQRRFWSVATIESYKHTAALLEKDAQDEENEGRTSGPRASASRPVPSIHTA